MNPEENNIKTSEYPAAPKRKPSPRVKKNRKKLLIGGAVAGAFLVGIVSGSASAGSAEPEVVEKEVIKEVEVPGPEVEVEVPVTPEACASSLDQAEKIYDMYSEGFMIASEMLTAVDNRDEAGLTQLNSELDAVTAELEPALLSYYLESTECRG